MQTHLKGFGLENFRVFKDYTWFDFAPITILTGLNSSGKSSLNKALLLLKDNFERGNLPPYYTLTNEGWTTTPELLWERDSDPNENENEFHQVFEPSSLEFNGRVHGLNDPSQILNKGSEVSIFSLIIPYDIIIRKNITTEDIINKLNELSTKEPNLSIVEKVKELGVSRSDLNKIIEKLKNDEELLSRFNNKKLNDKQLTLYTIKYRLDFLVENSKAKSLNGIQILDYDDICILKITDHEIYFDLKVYNKIINLDNSKTEKSIANAYKRTIHSNHEANLETWFQENDISTTEEKCKDILSSLGVSNKFQLFSVKKLDNLFKTIDFSAPSHNKQKRIYSEDDISEFKKTMQHLYFAGARGIQFDNFFKKCSKLFAIDGFFTFEYDKEKDTYFPNINGSSLLNFGYGYNQLASLLFKIASHASEKYTQTIDGEHIFDDKTSILIIEEPEANLHPRFQSLLANFFVESSDAFNIQFIIETHSECLIRKLQYLTAKKTIKPSDSVIYYFNHPDNVPIGEKQVKKIEILKDGSLTDEFGPGFFDEATNWKFELLRLKNVQNN